MSSTDVNSQGRNGVGPHLHAHAMISGTGTPTGASGDGNEGENDLLQFQPKPVGLIVIPYPPARPNATIITREWANGDHTRCQLCPEGRCGATPGGTCTIVVPWIVPPKLAALHVTTR